MDPIILYHFPFSPVSRAVILTARSLDLELEIKKVNLFARENMEPWYLEINPQHSVPCINDNGHILNESRAISQYLVNSRAPDSSLYPSDPKIRSIVDQRLYFDATTVFARMGKIFGAIKCGATEITDEQVSSIHEVLKWINGFLVDSKWMAGDEVTIADLHLLGTLSSLMALDVKLDDYPEVQRWFEQCKELPGYEENAKITEELGAKFKSKITKGF